MIDQPRVHPRIASTQRIIALVAAGVIALSTLASARGSDPVPGAPQPSRSIGEAPQTQAPTGLELSPDSIVAAGCSGGSQVFTLSAGNFTGAADTIDLTYDVSTANGVLTGPATLSVADGAIVTFTVTLSSSPCLGDVEVAATVTATGTTDADITTLTSSISNDEFGSITDSAPSWAGTGHPADGCTAQNGSGEWVTFLLGDSNGPLTGFWAYNHNTNSWFLPAATGTPADRWAPDWAYDPANNTCFLTGGATTPGSGDLTSAYSFDPVTQSFSPLPDFSTARNFHDSWVAEIDNTDFLCIGGGLSGSGALASTQCYDLDSAPVAWEAESSTLSAYPTATWGAADGVRRPVAGDQLWFVAGVQDGEVSDLAHYWDDADNQWHSAGATGLARYRLEGDFFEDRFYQVGGADGGFGFTGEAVIGTFVDPSWEWEVVPGLPNPRMDLVAAVTGSSLVVVDGYGSAETDYVDAWQACANPTGGWLQGTIQDLGQFCADPGPTCTSTTVAVDPPGATFPVDSSTGSYGPILLAEGTYDVTPAAVGYPAVSDASVSAVGCVTTTQDWFITRPGIEVADNPFQVNGVVGLDTTAALTVENDGCLDDLVFTVTEPIPLDWVRQEPSSGVITVPELNSFDLGLVFTCDTLEDHAGDLWIEHNDPCRPPLTVRLELQCLTPEIFEDGFESGDTSAWDLTVP